MTADPDLEQNPGIQSIRRDGFLSEAIDFMLPALREMHAPWFDFAERTNRLGQRIMNSAEAACVGRTTHDPVSLEARVAAADQALKGKARLSVEDIAEKGDFGDFYTYFKQLSAWSAHPSFYSLSKHLRMNPDGSWSGHVTGPADSEGMAQALTLGTHALLVNLAAFNGVWPGGDGAGEVADRLEGLSNMPAMKTACARTSRPSIFRTWPFRIIAIVSKPANVLRAVRKQPKPSPGRTSRLMRR